MFTRPCVTKKVAACYEPLRGDLISDSSFAASDTMITQPSAIAQRFRIPDRSRQPPARPALGRERDGSVTSPGRSEDSAGGGWEKRRLFLNSEQDE